MKIKFIGMPKIISNLMHEYYSPKWSRDHFSLCQCVYHKSDCKLPCLWKCESIRWYLYRVTRIRGSIGWMLWKYILGSTNDLLAFIKYRILKQYN